MLIGGCSTTLKRADYTFIFLSMQTKTDKSNPVVAMR